MVLTQGLQRSKKKITSERSPLSKPSRMVMIGYKIQKDTKKALMIVLREIDTISNSDICDTSKNLYLSKSCFKVCRQ